MSRTGKEKLRVRAFADAEIQAIALRLIADAEKDAGIPNDPIAAYTYGISVFGAELERLFEGGDINERD